MSPIVFIQGCDQIPPGSGNALHSTIAGQEKVIFVAPADDYGMYDEHNLLRVPRGVLPAGCMLGLGQGQPLRSRETGQVYQAYVDEIGLSILVSGSPVRLCRDAL